LNESVCTHVEDVVTLYKSSCPTQSCIAKSDIGVELLQYRFKYITNGVCSAIHNKTKLAPLKNTRAFKGEHRLLAI